MQHGEAKHSDAKPFIVEADQFSLQLDKKEKAIRIAVKNLSDRAPADEKLKALLPQISQFYEAVSNLKKILQDKVFPVRKQITDQKKLFETIFADIGTLDQTGLNDLMSKIRKFVASPEPKVKDKELEELTRDVVSKIRDDLKITEQHAAKKLAALELDVTSGTLESQFNVVQKLSETVKSFATKEEKKERKENAASASDLQRKIRELESEFKKIQAENKQIQAEIKRHESVIQLIRQEIATWNPLSIIAVRMRDQKDMQARKNAVQEIDAAISALNHNISDAREYLIKTKLLTAEYLQLLSTLSMQSQPVKESIELLKSMAKAIEPKTKASMTTQATHVVKSATVKTVGTAYSIMQSTVGLLRGATTPAKEVKQEEKKQEKAKQPKDMETEELWSAFSASLIGMQELMNNGFLTPIQQIEQERDRMDVYFSTKSLDVLAQLRRDLVDVLKFEQISDEQKDFLKYSHPEYSSARQLFTTKEAKIIDSIRVESVMQSHLEVEQATQLQRIDVVTKKQMAELRDQQKKIQQALAELEAQIKQLPISVFVRRDRTMSDRDDAIATALLLTSRKSSAEKKDKGKVNETSLPQIPEQISNTISMFRSQSQNEFTKENYRKVLEAYAGLFAFRATTLDLKTEFDTQIFAGLMLDHNLLRYFLNKIKESPGEYFNSVINTIETIKKPGDIDHLKTQSQVMGLFRKLINDLEHEKVKEFDLYVEKLGQKIEVTSKKPKRQ